MFKHQTQIKVYKILSFFEVFIGNMIQTFEALGIRHLDIK